MPSALGYIFGTPQKVSNFTPTQSSTLDPSQTQAQSELLNTLYTQSGAEPANVFPTATLGTAPTSDLQNISLDALSAGTPGYGGAAAAAGPAQGADISQLLSILGSKPTDLNSYYQTNVAQPLTQTFEQTTLPDIVSALGGNQGGPQSTAAADAVGQAARDFGTTLASTQANLALNQGQLTTANQLAAAGQLPGATAAPQSSLITSLGAGAVPQQIAQAGLSNQYTTATGANQNTQQALSDLISVLGTPTQTSSSAVVDPGTSGILSSVIQGLVKSFAGSDRKFKKDIKKVGESDSGFPLYRFRYKDDPAERVHVGLMAQDVKKRRPEAVLETPVGGLLTISEALDPRSDKERKAA